MKRLFLLSLLLASSTSAFALPGGLICGDYFSDREDEYRVWFNDDVSAATVKNKDGQVLGDLKCFTGTSSYGRNLTYCFTEGSFETHAGFEVSVRPYVDSLGFYTAFLYKVTVEGNQLLDFLSCR